MRKKHYRSKIFSISDMSGQIITDSQVISEHFQGYYKALLGTQQVRTARVETEVVRLGKVLTKEHQLSLIRPVTKQEVKDALWSISDIKSPSPDGYGSGFFKATWHIVEHDVFATVSEFFRMRRLLKNLSKTNLVLIPKTDVPRTVSDYRPTACCGVCTSA